jgi:hypothetical protein
MFNFWLSRFNDPGRCPICDAPHHTCTSYDGAIVVTPATGPVTVTVPVRAAAPPTKSEEVQATLPAGQFTTVARRPKKADAYRRATAAAPERRGE